jgi:hypothetical protein
MTTQILPRGYAPTVGVTSAQIMPQNPSRSGIIFYNASTTVSVAVCPAFDNNSAPLPAVLNGAGSYTLLPQSQLRIDNLNCSNAWNAIAGAPATPFTAWEF